MEADSLSTTEQISHRELHAQSIFGEQSQRVYSYITEQPPQEIQPLQSPQNSNRIEITAAITIMLYAVWIVKLIAYRKRGDYTEKRWIFGGREERKYEKISISMGDLLLSMSLMFGLLIMLLQAGMIWAEFIGTVEPQRWFPQVLLRASHILMAVKFQHWIIGISLYLLLTTALIAVIYALASRLSFRSEWLRQIIRLKARMIYPIMLYMMPFVIFLSLDSGNKTLGYVVLSEVVIMIAGYIIYSFFLFVSQKISILQWFLYLCTVEILPISLVWVFFVRSATINL